MTELQQNRYDRLLRRVGGLIGAKSMVNDALGELFPVIEVENVPAELLALMGTQLGWCSTEQAASIGNMNHHQLFNPAESQALLVVTQVAVNTDATGTFRLHTAFNALTTLSGNERRRDTRAGTLASIVGQSRREQNATSGGLEFRFRMIADVQQYITDQNGIAVLFPGTGLVVSSQATNLFSSVSFLWRERVFEGSELVDSG